MGTNEIDQLLADAGMAYIWIGARSRDETLLSTRYV